MTVARLSRVPFSQIPKLSTAGRGKQPSPETVELRETIRELPAGEEEAGRIILDQGESVANYRQKIVAAAKLADVKVKTRVVEEEDCKVIYFWKPGTLAEEEEEAPARTSSRGRARRGTVEEG
jgi:hypothetical protein